MAEEKLEQHEEKDLTDFKELKERIAQLEKHCGLDKKALSKDEAMRARARK